MGLPELRCYRRFEMPPLLAAQVRSYVRMQWPFVHAGSSRLWDYTPGPDSPLHFVIVEDEVLISHGHVRRREVTIGGQRVKVDAVSAVFTYPDFRKAGHAGTLVKRISHHIRSSGADLGMLFAGAGVRKLYEKHGWQWETDARVLYGDPANSTLHTSSNLMTLTVSDAGRAAGATIASEPIYVGEETW